MHSLKLATKADAVKIAVLLKELHAASIYGSLYEYNVKDVTDVALAAIENYPEKGAAICLYAEEEIVGVILCSVMHHLFNQKEKSAVELGFWIKPQHRNFKTTKTLLGAYRYWAKRVGCTSIMYGKLKDKSRTEEYIIRKIT